MWHPIRHFCTITHHRMLVAKYCFRLGLYWQGLTHDLSKYSPPEFLVGARYYQGDHSPNEAERAERGYSSSWLHHHRQPAHGRHENAGAICGRDDLRSHRRRSHL